MRILIDYKTLAERHPEATSRLVAKLPRVRRGQNPDPMAHEWCYEYHLPYGRDPVEHRLRLNIEVHSGGHFISEPIDPGDPPPEVRDALYPPVVTREDFDHFARIPGPDRNSFLVFGAFRGRMGTEFVARIEGDPATSLRLPPYTVRVTGGGDVEYIAPFSKQAYGNFLAAGPDQTFQDGARKLIRMSRAQAIAAVRDVATWVEQAG